MYRNTPGMDKGFRLSGVMVTGIVLAGISAAVAPSAYSAEAIDTAPHVMFTDAGQIIAGDQVFDTRQEYFQSEFFHEHGMRCGTKKSDAQVMPRASGGADCTLSITNPDAVYDPSVVKYRIAVVVHVLRHSNGTTGNVSEAMVQSQIDILNEDYLALPGSNGAPGTDVQIEFYLATEDAGGNPTNGITYSNNTTWYNDSGTYYNTLAWDTNRFLNIYTNTAGGYLGYVPALPQQGIVGSNQDRVVIAWDAFGRNSPAAPYNLGRTATHEVGHYLGLEHTFNGGGCPSASIPACYSNGDLICDTEVEQNERYSCFGSSCGTPDPIHNYMDYTNDSCMWELTPEQARRTRCTLENYRPNLYTIAPVCGPGSGAGDCPPGDFDQDGDVDKADHMIFVDCLAGPDQASSPTSPVTAVDCYNVFDFDGDSDVDLQDFKTLQDSSAEF